MENSTKIKIKDNPILRLFARIGKIKFGRVGLLEILIVIGLIAFVVKVLPRILSTSNN